MIRHPAKLASCGPGGSRIPDDTWILRSRNYLLIFQTPEFHTHPRIPWAARYHGTAAPAAVPVPGPAVCQPSHPTAREREVGREVAGTEELPSEPAQETSSELPNKLLICLLTEQLSEEHRVPLFR